MTRGLVLFIVAAAAVFLGLSQVIEPLEFCDAPGVIIVFGCTVILLYISFPLSDIFQGVGFVFSGRKEIPAGKYLRLTRLYQAAGDYFLYCGVLGMLIGFVMMLQTMIDFSDLGPLLALSLLTVLYGVAGKLFTLLLLHKLSLCATDGDERDGPKPHHTPAAFIISLVLFSLVIVLAVAQSGELVSLYEPAALLIVVVGSPALALLCSTPSGLTRAFGIAFSRGDNPPEDTLKGLKVFCQLNDSILATAVIAAVAGFVATLGVLPDPSNIGPRVALSMVSLAYGIYLACLVRGLYYTLQRRLCLKNLEFEPRLFFSPVFILLFSLLISTLFWAVLIILLSTEG